MFPVIDNGLCALCGMCIDACPHDVLEFVGSQVEPVNVEDCTGCRACEFACPIGAIVGIMNR